MRCDLTQSNWDFIGDVVAKSGPFVCSYELQVACFHTQPLHLDHCNAPRKCTSLRQFRELERVRHLELEHLDSPSSRSFHKGIVLMYFAHRVSMSTHEVKGHEGCVFRELMDCHASCKRRVHRQRIRWSSVGAQRASHLECASFRCATMPRRASRYAPFGHFATQTCDRTFGQSVAPTSSMRAN